MLSDRLKHFFGAYCNIDADPEETTAFIRSGKGELPWLQAELSAAVTAGLLTNETLTSLTSIAFDDQAAADNWLQGRWASWFPGEAFPAA